MLRNRNAAPTKQARPSGSPHPWLTKHLGSPGCWAARRKLATGSYYLERGKEAADETEFSSQKERSLVPAPCCLLMFQKKKKKSNSSSFPTTTPTTKKTPTGLPDPKRNKRKHLFGKHSWGLRPSGIPEEAASLPSLPAPSGQGSALGASGCPRHSQKTHSAPWLKAPASPKSLGYSCSGDDGLVFCLGLSHAWSVGDLSLSYWHREADAVSSSHFVPRHGHCREKSFGNTAR